LPSINGPTLLLPPSYTQFIVNRPETEISLKAVQSEVLATDYTFYTKKMYPQLDLHEHIIRNDLTRQLGKLTPEFMEELASSFSELWGTNSEDWNSVNVFDTCSKAIVRTSHRMIAGPALCHNDDYLSACTGYARAVPVTFILIRLCPKILRPILAPFVTIPLRYYLRKIRRWTDPIVLDHSAAVNPSVKSSYSKSQGSTSDNFIQWLITKAKSEDIPNQLDLETVAHRILIVHFFSVNTLTFAVTNAIFDLFSSPSPNTLEELRQEASQVLAEENGIWTKPGVAKMNLLDSAIRESLRSNGFSAVGLGRKIIADKGLTLDNGVLIPKGIRIAVANYGLHHDADLYPHPNEYDAFRFSRRRGELMSNSNGQEVESKSNGKNSGNEKTTSVLAHRNLSMVSTSPTYMAFGHGRHACPGRFFAANTMKLIMAYIMLYYNVQPLEQRPENEGMAEAIVPPLKATLRVRRRKMVGVGASV
jgi:cytochrome P450